MLEQFANLYIRFVLIKTLADVIGRYPFTATDPLCAIGRALASELQEDRDEQRIRRYAAENSSTDRSADSSADSSRIVRDTVARD